MHQETHFNLFLCVSDSEHLQCYKTLIAFFNTLLPCARTHTQSHTPIQNKYLNKINNKKNIDTLCQMLHKKGNMGSEERLIRWSKVCIRAQDSGRTEEDYKCLYLLIG